jgi:hypothetical protein
MLNNNVFYLIKCNIFAFLFLFFFILFFPLVSRAQRYGFSGEIGFVYARDTIESGAGTAELTNIEQRYRLNYINYIYKPKLLTYTLGGTFQKVDAKSDSNDASAKSTGYDARLNFLSETPYPFVVWANKRTPTSFSSQLTGAAVFNKQDTRGFGIYGGLYMRRIPRIRYSFKQEDKETTSLTETTEVRDRQISFNMQKEWKGIDTEFSYGYESSLDKNSGSDQKNHDYRLVGRTLRKLSEISDIAVSTDLHKNSFSDVTEILVSSQLNYIPSERFTGRLNTNYNHTVQTGKGGNNFVTNANTVYRLSRTLTLANDGLFVYNTGYFGDNMAEKIGSTISYTDEIAKNLRLSGTALLKLGARQGDPFNRTTMNTRISSTLTKNYPSTRTFLSTSGAAGYYASSAGGRNEIFSMAI